MEAEMPEHTHLTCLSCGQLNRVATDRLVSGPVCGRCGAALADGTVAESDLARLETAVRRDGLPIVVDIWAPWCGPCRTMAPEFARAAAGLAGQVRFVKVDSDRHPDAAARFSVRGIPTLLRFENGRETARSSGARPAAAIGAFARGDVTNPA
jgi:thioredoxin 2